jgi:DNA-binding NarL/FixJ family response regulator
LAAVIRVVIANDQALSVEAIAQVLKGLGKFELVGTGAPGA